MEKTYELIRSLTKSEKRMIKIRLTANKSDSILNTQFDLISKQSNFDLSALSRATKQPENLTKVSLRLLFEVVLKHLRSSDSTKPKDLELRDLLANVKTLKDRKLIDEAGSRCAKLIKDANHYEEFTVLHEACFEFWNIHLLKTELSEDKHGDLKGMIEDCEEKINQLNHLEAVYRDAAFLYQEFYFKKRSPETKAKLIEAIEYIPSKANLLSNKATHTFYEIKCIESVVLANEKLHHNLRKEQLSLLFSTHVFESYNLHKLLVLSNIFMFFKSKGLINHLKSYLNFTEQYFSIKVTKDQDWTLSERYFDIYFQNEIYVQVWLPDKERLEELIIEFKNILKKKLIVNNQLISRIYLAFIEILIISNELKKAQEFLVDFFYLLKKSKNSINYIQGEIYSIIANSLLGNLDVSESQTTNLKRKIRRYEIDLGKDLATLFQLLQHNITRKEQSVNDYLNEIDIRMTFKLLVFQLKEGFTTSNLIREQHFMIKDKDYDEANDDYLNSLKQFI